MICRLNNQDIDVATNMQKVFYASYSVEAKILKAANFPPLTRSIDQYKFTDTDFYGLKTNKELAGIVEVRRKEFATHIQSLVVHPKYFKQGIASQLMKYVIKQYDSQLIFVETGIDNIPAIKLYEKFGFKQTKQWDADCEIRKVRLEMLSLSSLLLS